MQWVSTRQFKRIRKENMWVGSCIHIVCWFFLYSGSFAIAFWIFCVCPCIGLVLLIYLSHGSQLYSHIGSSFGMFLALPVLDLSCIRTLDLHLACFLHLLCWILAVFIHWIFGCFVSVAILWIKPLISCPVYTGVLLLAQALLLVCKYRRVFF